MNHEGPSVVEVFVVAFIVALLVAILCLSFTKDIEMAGSATNTPRPTLGTVTPTVYLYMPVICNDCATATPTPRPTLTACCE